MWKIYRVIENSQGQIRVIETYQKQRLEFLFPGNIDIKIRYLIISKSQIDYIL